MAISESTTGVKSTSRGCFLKVLLYGKHRINNEISVTVNWLKYKLSEKIIIKLSKVGL